MNYGMSVWRNDIKCKYMFIYPERFSHKELIYVILDYFAGTEAAMLLTRCQRSNQWPLLLTWINFNPSMYK